MQISFAALNCSNLAALSCSNLAAPSCSNLVALSCSYLAALSCSYLAALSCSNLAALYVQRVCRPSYAPNFEKVDGAYCFWSVPARVLASHFLYLL